MLEKGFSWTDFDQMIALWEARLGLPLQIISTAAAVLGLLALLQGCSPEPVPVETETTTKVVVEGPEQTTSIEHTVITRSG